MQNKWILVLAAFMFVLFSSFFNLFFGEGISEKRKIASKIAKEVSKEYKSKYGLNYMGISEAAVDGKYKTIGLELSCPKILTKDQGRILLLCCLRDALEAFNSHPEFRPYMVDVPFTSGNLIINIYTQSARGPEVYYPDIGVFVLYNNVLSYDYDTPESSFFEYFAEEKESYEEALKIVQGRQKRAETTKEQM